MEGRSLYLTGATMAKPRRDWGCKVVLLGADRVGRGVEGLVTRRRKSVGDNRRGEEGESLCSPTVEEF
jgi:hypothetical protein